MPKSLKTTIVQHYIMEMEVMKRKKNPWGEEGSLILFCGSVYKAISPRRPNPKHGSGSYYMDVVYLCEDSDLPPSFNRKTLLDGVILHLRDDWRSNPGISDLVEGARTACRRYGHVPHAMAEDARGV